MGIKLRTNCTIMCDSGGFQSSPYRVAVSCVRAPHNRVGEQQCLDERNASIVRVC